MASYNHFVTDPYAVLTIQLTMLFIYSGLALIVGNDGQGNMVIGCQFYRPPYLW